MYKLSIIESEWTLKIIIHDVFISINEEIESQRRGDWTWQIWGESLFHLFSTLESCFRQVLAAMLVSKEKSKSYPLKSQKKECTIFFFFPTLKHWLFLLGSSGLLNWPMFSLDQAIYSFVRKAITDGLKILTPSCKVYYLAWAFWVGGSIQSDHSGKPDYFQPVAILSHYFVASWSLGIILLAKWEKKESTKCWGGCLRGQTWISLLPSTQFTLSRTQSHNSIYMQ